MPGIELRPPACPISGEAEARRVFVYDEPPSGEVGFKRAPGEPYHREVWQFATSRHYVSRHSMTVFSQYDGAYVDATYRGDAGLAAAFEKIIALPPEKSDNAARVARIRKFAETWFERPEQLRVLDVGAGLGVFPYAARNIGWSCTAIDPDARAVQHLRDRVGVEAICGDFMRLEIPPVFDLVTFNKVLEHVEDPIAMLRRAQSVLGSSGIVYIELPDGEMASKEGADREEFYIEHLHIFSFASLVMLANRAGFTPICVERLREPSSKFTLRAFVAPER